MRYLVMGMIILFLLAWLWPNDNPTTNPDMSGTLTGFLAALGAAFEWFAALDHAFHQWMWEMMSGELRAVLGALKCLIIILALWGLYALGLLMRLVRRMF